MIPVALRNRLNNAICASANGHFVISSWQKERVLIEVYKNQSNIIARLPSEGEVKYSYSVWPLLHDQMFPLPVLCAQTLLQPFGSTLWKLTSRRRINLRPFQNTNIFWDFQISRRLKWNRYGRNGRWSWWYKQIKASTFGGFRGPKTENRCSNSLGSNVSYVCLTGKPYRHFM